MEHPFINKADLKELSVEQLQEKMSSITTKLTFAYRTGNGPLIHQLQMVSETYRNQLTAKMDELFEKQNIKHKINIESDKQ
jgi:hypothetical protein